MRDAAANLYETHDEKDQVLTEIRAETLSDISPKLNGKQRIGIAVSSPDQLFLAGMIALVEQWDEFQVVAKATDTAGTLRACRTAKPAVCLVNTTLGDAAHLDFIRTIVKQAPDTKVIVISPSGADNDVIEALRAGIHGYCVQNSIKSDRLRGMIWGILSGAVMLFGLERSKLTHSDQTATESDPRFDSLTQREKDILLLLTRGFSNADIGRELYLSEATVKKNIARITDKLQVDNRVQAAVLAARHLDQEERR